MSCMRAVLSSVCRTCFVISGTVQGHIHISDALGHVYVVYPLLQETSPALSLTHIFSILESYLKDHVTLKTVVIMEITFYNIFT